VTHRALRAVRFFTPLDRLEPTITADASFILFSFVFLILYRSLFVLGTPCIFREDFKCAHSGSGGPYLLWSLVVGYGPLWDCGNARDHAVCCGEFAHFRAEDKKSCHNSAHMDAAFLSNTPVAAADGPHGRGFLRCRIRRHPAEVNDWIEARDVTALVVTEADGQINLRELL